ncbi:MAG: saccharopine dehydrogenase family protein [Actinomycetales bacterium]
MSRDFDLTLYGATGFVGRLVAEHLAAHAPQGLRIALAGRNKERLREVKTGLGEAAQHWSLAVAAADDEAALTQLAESSRVIVSTVGPYQRLGLPLVQACAAAGTHYADLTGEVLFVRQSIDTCHALAQQTGARIVHSCGFDSIPSDLGVLVLHEAAGELTDTTFALLKAKGGFSGGTIASMREQLDAVRSDRAARRIAGDPYALSPDRAAEPDLGNEHDLTKPVHDPQLGWLAPFVMASYNTRIVRRSNALSDYAYGRRFRYREVVGTGRGRLAPVIAGGITAALGALVAGLSFGPTRSLLDRVLPSPGEGPSESTRQQGSFFARITTTNAAGERWTASVGAQGDPGYGATAVMLGQSALALALDDLPPAAGVLTPATGIGQPLVERLRAQGFTFSAAQR